MKGLGPEAVQASENQIKDQVERRYGIDVNITGADEASVSAALAREQQARSETESEPTKATAARNDAVLAGASSQAGQRRRLNRPTTPRSGISSSPKASKVRATVKQSAHASW